MAKKSINEYESFTGDPALVNILVQEKSQNNPSSFAHKKMDLGLLLSSTYGELNDSFNLCMGALANYLTEMRTLITQMVFSTSNNNGADTIEALDTAVTALVNSSSTKRKIIKSLTHCTLSNGTSLVIDGSSYTSSLTADSTYMLSTVSITMGGVDITSTAWTSGTGTISIPTVTGDVVIIAEAVEEYTAETIYENYVSTGSRFYTDDININWDNGDYVEAVLDMSSDNIVDNSNVFGISPKLVNVGGNPTAYLEMSTGKGVLFYKRERYGHNFNIRIVNVDESLDVTKYFDVVDFSNVTLKITKTGIAVDEVWGDNVRTYITNLITNQSVIALGACSTQRSAGIVYKTVKVYRHN